jgi:hypothetical protein
MRCLLLVLALTGCFPKMVETTRSVGAHWLPVKAGLPGPVELYAASAPGMLHITAVRSRRCSQELVGEFEHRRDYEQRDGGGMNLGNDVGLLLIALPVILVVGAVAAATAEKPSVKKYEETLDVVRVACPPLAAQVALDVTFPSGTTLHTSTDASGALSLAIPATEPAQGIALFHAPGLEQTVGYSRDGNVAFAPPSANVVVREAPPPPSPDSANSVSEERAVIEQQGFAAVRRALRSCGEREDVHGIVAAQLSIDVEGRVTSNPDRGGPAFTTCVNKALADARFPDGRAQKLVFPYQL